MELNGETVKYHREFDAVFVDLPEDIIPGRQYTLTIGYSGKPRNAPNPPWEGGFVWKRDKHFHRWVGVACEQYGASSWWPVKDHLSDRPDSMNIHIEVPSKFQAISNGQLRGVDTLSDGFSRYNWHVSYPINSYNVTFYMGKYTEFTDSIMWNDSLLTLRYHVMPYNLDIAREHFKQARDVVRVYNDAFGPFPFWRDDFRMVESPYEGMEHQTAIAYGNAYNNSKNSESYLNGNFDYIIVHEAAHEWWGNSVAAADMADVWLHEGFATYAEYVFLEAMLGYDKAREEIHHKMIYILDIWPMVQNYNVNEDAFAGGDVYTKGATMLHCLRATINNDSLFTDLIRNFQLSYRDSTCNSDDFIDFVNQYTGKDFSAFFSKYLYDTGLPVLEYSYTRENGGIRLKYKWDEVEDGFEMPLAIKTFDTEHAIRLMATTKEQEIFLENAKSFNFYNEFVPLDNCPRNSLTYFRTRARL